MEAKKIVNKSHLTWILLSSLSLGFLGCQRDNSANIPVFQGKESYPSFRESDFSTPSETGDQTVGTRVTTYFTLDVDAQNGKTILQRKFDSVGSEGFHRNSLPMEIAFRGNLGLQVQGQQMVVTGMEELLGKVIPGLPVRRKSMISDLLEAKYVEGYVPDLQDWWTLSQLVRGPVQIPSRLDSLKGRPLSRSKIDSVFVEGWDDQQGESALKYTVYYERPDSAMGLQMHLQAIVAAKRMQKILKGTLNGPTQVKIRHTFWVNPDNGRLIREEEKRDYVIQRMDSTGKPIVFDAYTTHLTVYRDE